MKINNFFIGGVLGLNKNIVNPALIFSHSEEDIREHILNRRKAISQYQAIYDHNDQLTGYDVLPVDELHEIQEPDHNPRNTFLYELRLFTELLFLLKKQKHNPYFFKIKLSKNFISSLLVLNYLKERVERRRELFERIIIEVDDRVIEESYLLREQIDYFKEMGFRFMVKVSNNCLPFNIYHNTDWIFNINVSRYTEKEIKFLERMIFLYDSDIEPKVLFSGIAELSMIYKCQKTRKVVFQGGVLSKVLPSLIANNVLNM